MVEKDMTVLVIDDEKLVLTVVNSFLRKSRYFAVLAGDLAEAQRAAMESGRNIDIVLSDVSLPAVGKVEFWNYLRDQFPYARVVHMSGYPEDQVDVPEWKGPRYFLQKPFTLTGLMNVLERASNVVRSAGGC